MNWADVLADWPDLAPPAVDTAVRAAERRLGVTFPAEYRDFLAHADGGPLFVETILYRVGGPETEPASLVAANRARPGDFPLLAIGHDGPDAFGFRKVDLDDRTAVAGVYFASGLTWELDYAAPSLAAFLRDLAREGERQQADDDDEGDEIDDDAAPRGSPWWARWLPAWFTRR